MEMISAALSSRQDAVETLERFYDTYEADDSFRETLIRTTGTFLGPEEGETLWNRIIESDGIDMNSLMLTVIDRVSAEKQYRNMKHFARHKDPFIREGIAYITRRIEEPQKGLEILSLIAVDDNDSDIIETIAESRAILHSRLATKKTTQ